MIQIKDHIPPYLEFCRFRKELDEKTLKAYRIDLQQFLDYVNCDDPDRTVIEQYITELHKTCRPKTVKRKIASVKSFYFYLEETSVKEENPFRRIRVKFHEAQLLPRIIPRKEIEQLLNYMYDIREESPSRWLRDITVIEIFFATGARVYEISNMTTNCVNIDSGSICFMGKGDKERVVQISEPSILHLIREYYEEYREKIEKCGYFFVNRVGKRFSEQSIRNMMKKYALEAGIDRNITPHMFRHSFATYLIDEGVDISCVQHLLGHSSISTTQIYIHISTEKQAEILRDKHPRNRMQIHTPSEDLSSSQEHIAV